MDKTLSIEEGNKSIAEFISEQPGYSEKGTFIINHPDLDESNFYLWGEMNFHSSWDWLMPACHKFDMLDEFEGDERAFYEDHCDAIDQAATLYEIKPLWEALVNALVWHNSLPSQLNKTQTNE
jgi:hypothetical protein